VAGSPSILFDPAPDIAEAVLAAITDGSISFYSLAAAANTDPEALSLWMSRPDIRERIESVDRSTTWRTRLIASAHLHAVPPALTKILQDYLSQERAPSASSGSSPFDTPTSGFRAALLDARRAETTRKSAALLLTLTRTRPTTGPDLAPSAPAADHRNAEAPAAKSPATTRQSQLPTLESLQALVDQLAPDLESATDRSLGTTDTQEPTRPDNSQQSSTPGREAGAPSDGYRPTLAGTSLKSEISDLESASPAPASPHEHWP
jgi:hypothetical protein